MTHSGVANTRRPRKNRHAGVMVATGALYIFHGFPCMKTMTFIRLINKSIYIMFKDLCIAVAQKKC